MASAPQHPLPSEFTTDPRVFVDQQSGKHHYEDDNGQEWEWAGQVWIPLVRIRHTRVSSILSRCIAPANVKEENKEDLTCIAGR